MFFKILNTRVSYKFNLITALYLHVSESCSVALFLINRILLGFPFLFILQMFSNSRIYIICYWIVCCIVVFCLPRLWVVVISQLKGQSVNCVLVSGLFFLPENLCWMDNCYVCYFLVYLTKYWKHLLRSILLPPLFFFFHKYNVTWLHEVILFIRYSCNLSVNC